MQFSAFELTCIDTVASQKFVCRFVGESLCNTTALAFLYSSSNGRGVHACGLLDIRALQLLLVMSIQCRSNSAIYPSVAITFSCHPQLPICAQLHALRLMFDSIPQHVHVYVIIICQVIYTVT